MSNNDLEYTSKIRNVVGVQFSISSPEEIINRSVCHVTETILYDNSGDPVINGLFDPRMGVIDNGKICPTDLLDNRFCPGYFGHIVLSKPVVYIQFLNMVFSVLKNFCIKCSSLLVLLTEDELTILEKLVNKDRMAYVTQKTSKTKLCPKCGSLVPSKFIKEGILKIFAVWKSLNVDIEPENKKIHLSPEMLLKMFKRISNEESAMVGFDYRWCRPEWFICTVLPVPPPTVRPSVRQGNGQRSEDDMTHKLIDILKTNNHIKKKLEAETSLENTIEEWVSVLQYHIATYIDNNIPGINQSTHRSGRVIKSIKERLKGKEGRMRGNLMGKRVDFCARSVITPDPNIKTNELGVPLKIAKNLTIPEMVNKYNINKLTKIVRNGPNKYPGAKSIEKKNIKKTISLLYIDTNSLELSEGDIIHRHLIDGDIVLFNRQPTLHKLSMMAHKIKVLDYYTFRLNVSVTTPYNADFDGDEMNMFVPQSLQAMIDIRNIALVDYQLISPRVHTPIITLVQDSLLGLNRLTNDGVYLFEKDMMNILMYIPTFSGILPKPDKKNPNRWSGRQLFSVILPTGFNINIRNNSYDDQEVSLNHVIIENGILIQGRIDKKVLSSGTRGIIHIIHNDYGHLRAKQFLDDTENLITRYLVQSGFSVGISDLISNRAVNLQIEKKIISKKKEVSKLIQNTHHQVNDHTNGTSVLDTFEKGVNNILNKAIAEAGKIALSSLDKDNRMTNMVSAGSKGKSINIAQMIACVGQQNVDGKRIPNGYNYRTLPHFCKYDKSPESGGFVERPFIKGLTPSQFYHHAQGGREGLIDTAVKTSETGYISRKLMKAMEDNKVFYDLSVRNAAGEIIQFIYGDDGFNYIKIESQFLDYLVKSFDKIEDIHRFDDNENFSLFLSPGSIKKLKQQKNYKERLETFFDKIKEDYDFIHDFVFRNNEETSLNLPVNLFRIINNAKHLFDIRGTTLSDIDPVYVIEKIEDLIGGLPINHVISNNILFNIMIRNYLSPKYILRHHRINKVGLNYIIDTIKLLFDNSKIEANEMVGAIAAQSIGEPATQMTLNTFHFAGISSKSNVTRGVPRLKELLHLSKNLKAPSLTIYLKDDISYDKFKSQTVLNEMELTKLVDILNSVNVYYDPDDTNTLIEEDRELLQVYKLFCEVDDELRNNETSSNWIIRFELNKDKMLNKDITMELLYYRLNLLFPEDISCVYSDDNSNKLIFRIRILKKKKGDFNKINDINYIKNIVNNILEKVVIKGVKKIKNISMFKKNKKIKQENSYVNKEEWILDTNGTNLIDILQNKHVDRERTVTNDIYEMFSIFGIEAARNIIMMEIKEVISGGGSYVNYRHLNMLCDMMTKNGSMMSIDRFGINRDNIGPLAKASFEETTDQLFKASVFGEKDQLTGVSSNIMLGQIAPCGTGAVNILLDESKLTTIEHAQEEIENINTWGDDEDYCDMNMGLDYDISNLDAENNLDIPVVGINK
jgi:DNA-directed RNA polymerase II subunit RPB1